MNAFVKVTQNLEYDKRNASLAVKFDKSAIFANFRQIILEVL